MAFPRHIFFLIGAAVAAIPVALACSGSTAAFDACGALSACCDQMTGVAQTTCQSFVSAGKQEGASSTCNSELQSFQQAGLCGAGAHADAGVGCSLPGACPAQQGDGSVSPTQPTGTVTPGPTPTPTPTPTMPPPPPPPFDAGIDCGSTPALHPEAEAGVYCPFAAAGAIHCLSGEQCCEAPANAGAASTCAPLGTGCPIVGSIAWGCNGPVDCAASADGPVCCAVGNVAVDPACGYYYGSGITSSHCATSCAAGEINVCDAPGECPTATVCTPFKVAGVHLGACM